MLWSMPGSHKLAEGTAEWLITHCLYRSPGLSWSLLFKHVISPSSFANHRVEQRCNNGDELVPSLHGLALFIIVRATYFHVQKHIDACLPLALLSGMDCWLLTNKSWPLNLSGSSVISHILVSWIMKQFCNKGKLLYSLCFSSKRNSLWGSQYTQGSGINLPGHSQHLQYMARFW